MRVDRLVLEAAGRSVALDLHPRLTVVNGVGGVEREGLVSEFVGALGSRRSGVHLELTWDDGAQAGGPADRAVRSEQPRSPVPGRVAAVRFELTTPRL